MTPIINGIQMGIPHDGAEYGYDPVFVEIRPDRSSTLAEAVSRCFQSRFIGCYTAVKLRWMKPDGNGGLVPR